jgi:radical SAM superfamily enzyme YgiQ (UPF0313 family)
MTTDVVCVNLPKFEANVLPSALAVLQGIAQAHNVNCKILDFNLDWIDACRAHQLERREILTGITWNTAPSDAVKDLIAQQVSIWADKILDQQSRVLAVSVFTYYGQYFAHQLCKLVRERNPTINIVIGGAGLASGILESPLFAQAMLDRGLVDEYLSGNAETTWLRFLDRTFSLGLDDLNDLFLNTKYINNYQGFEIERYRSNVELYNDNYIDNKIVVGFTGSEGCVRECDFCEIHRYSNFRQRSAAHIALNIKSAMSQVGDCHFEFTDSLVNGNLKEFNRVLDEFIEIKKTYPDFSWSGQFIVRGAEQHPDHFWKKISQSGAKILYLGVETGSDRLRFAMNKRFTNQDLDHTMAMLDRHKIQCVFMQFIGHPEETAEDFQNTLDMYTRYQQYSKWVLSRVQLNWMMCIYENTPLHEKAERLGLKFTSDPGLWYATSNPTLTVEERVRRRLLLSEHLDQLGFVKAHDDHVQLSEMARAYSKYKYAIKIINRT